MTVKKHIWSPQFNDVTPDHTLTVEGLRKVVTKCSHYDKSDDGCAYPCSKRKKSKCCAMCPQLDGCLAAALVPCGLICFALSCNPILTFLLLNQLRKEKDDENA